MPDFLQPCVLTFTPVYKPYVWGGVSLPARLGRADAPKLDRYAESWELADHPDGMSVVSAGALAGRSLHDLVQRFGSALAGSAGPVFPILVKIIDAADRLSVQVHPDDLSARRYGGEAKTECWYVLDAAPGASIWAGLLPGVSALAFRRALGRGDATDLLQQVPVSRGDVLFIPGGRLHAIGAGCLMLEVQQPSNTTYRVFDWNRPGTDGKLRPLHVEEAMRTIRWNDTEPALVPAGMARVDGANTIWERLSCPYFRLEELSLREPLDTRHDGSTFHALYIRSGGVCIRGDGFEAEFPAGVTALVPAAARAYTLAPRQAEAMAIRLSGPPPGRS